MQALEAASFMGIYRDCHSSRNKLSNVKSFIILQLGEGLKSFNKHKCANFSGERKEKGSFLGCIFFENIMQKKKLSQISSLSLKISLFLKECHVKIKCCP